MSAFNKTTLVGLGGYPTAYNGFPPQRDKLNPIRIDVADNVFCVRDFYQIP